MEIEELAVADGAVDVAAAQLPIFGEPADDEHGDACVQFLGAPLITQTIGQEATRVWAEQAEQPSQVLPGARSAIRL